MGRHRLQIGQFAGVVGFFLEPGAHLVQQAVEGLAVQWQQLAHAQQAAQRQHVFVNRIGHAGIADLDHHLTAVDQLGAVHLAN